MKKKGLIVNKRLRSIPYVEGRIRECAEREKDNEHFYRFDCCSFFEGEKQAELNKKIYYKRYHAIEKEWRQLHRILETLK